MARTFVRFKAEDGLPYYYCAADGSTQWDRPSEFESDEEQRFGGRVLQELVRMHFLHAPADEIAAIMSGDKSSKALEKLRVSPCAGCLSSCNADQCVGAARLPDRRILRCSGRVARSGAT